MCRDYTGYIMHTCVPPKGGMHRVLSQHLAVDVITWDCRDSPDHVSGIDVLQVHAVSCLFEMLFDMPSQELADVS